MCIQLEEWIESDGWVESNEWNFSLQNSRAVGDDLWTARR